jgi:hypothetical protein
MYGNLIFDFSKFFDPKHAKLIYAQAKELSTLGSLQEGKRVKSSKIVIEVLINGIAVNALWDTHGHTSFSKSFIGSHPKLFTKMSQEISQDVIGHIQLRDIYTFKGSATQPQWRAILLRLCPFGILTMIPNSPMTIVRI